MLLSLFGAVLRGTHTALYVGSTHLKKGIYRKISYRMCVTVSFECMFKYVTTVNSKMLIAIIGGV